MKNTKSLGLLFLPFLLLGIFVVTTDPYKLPIPLLPVPFLLLGVGVYRLALRLLRISPLSSRKASFIAGTLTAVILLLTILQSIRQLSVKDFLILAVLLIGMTFYMRRIDI